MTLTRTRLFSGLLISSLALGGCKDTAGSEIILPELPEVPEHTILMFDNFDAENNGAGIFNWTAFQQWNVVEGCVDLHGNGFIDLQPGNGLFVDLDGTCLQGGTIESKQAFTLQPGNHRLEFWLAGNLRGPMPDTVDVTLGSLYQEQFVMGSQEPFRLISRSIVVSTATTARLRFKQYGGDDFGALLDLVRLRRVE